MFAFTHLRTHIRTWLRWLCLILIDTYIDICNHYKQWQTSRAIARAIAHKPSKLIFAYARGDITAHLHAFYQHNDNISAFRLQTWMRKCNHACDQLHIYTNVDGDVRHSLCDLIYNMELLTNTPFDDMCLDTMPSHVMA